MRRAPVRPAMARAGSVRAARAAFILPMPSSRDSSSAPAAPKPRGRAVSSMVRADTPAVSSSSTVRITLRALP